MPQLQETPVKLYRPDKPGPMELPILSKELGLSSELAYSQYLGRYVIVPGTWRERRDMRNNSESWRRGQPMPVYLLSRDGDVQTIDVPSGTWVTPHMAWPTRQGLFLASSNAPSTNSLQAGGWLLKDNRMIKLFDHLVSAAGVSPDGCKIAYANNDFNPQTTDYVRVIDLCR
jgi:hypothetical protein